MSDEIPLSDRERQVLERLVRGESNNEIAQVLVISPNTVKVHVRNIYGKLGVLSRTEATTEALRRNLVLLPGVNQPLPDADAGEPLPGAEVAPAVPEVAPPAGREVSADGPVRSRHVVVPHWALLSGLVLILGLVLAVVLVLLQERQVDPPRPVAASNGWQALANLPAPLADMAALYSDETIYLIGGSTPQTITASVRRFVPRSGQWSELAPLLVPTSQAQAVLIGEQVYVPGGLGASQEALDTLQILDLVTGSWSYGPPLPAPRYAYALAAIDGRLFVFGGEDGSGTVATTLIFDPATRLWSEGTPLPLPLSHAASAQNANQVFVIGGLTGGNTPNRQTWRFRSDVWEERASLPDDRVDGRAVFVANQLYLIGGTPSSRPMLIYKPNIWSQDTLSQPHILQRQALVTDGRSMYMFGGWDGTYWLHNAQTWDPVMSIFVPMQSN